MQYLYIILNITIDENYINNYDIIVTQKQKLVLSNLHSKLRVYGEKNMKEWLDNIIKEQYTFVTCLKKDDKNLINVLENKELHKKVIYKEYEGDCEVYKKLINIKSRNLPIVYEAIEIEENNVKKSLIIEEYIDGISIDQILETGLYTSSGVKKVVRELCNALSILHRNGIVHRDIKPENIMVTDNGDVKLIDFNIARIDKNYSDDNNVNDGDKDTRILGTIGFAAPEQFGITKTDAKTDIYAVGILINVMLTGEHPSKKLCTGRWRKVVQKCTQINPNNRYKDVLEIIKY